MKKLIYFFMFLAVISIWPLTVGESAIRQVPAYEYQGDGEIKFFNTHTDELMMITYMDKKGRYLQEGIRDIDYILRCRLTGDQINMSLKLIALIDNIQDHFGGEKIEVISGYRSPKLNQTLRAQGKRVASRSLHMEGQAIDIRIPGVSTRKVREYAMSLKMGGVGYYSGPDFVHIDVGRVRHW